MSEENNRIVWALCAKAENLDPKVHVRCVASRAALCFAKVVGQGYGDARESCGVSSTCCCSVPCCVRFPVARALRSVANGRREARQCAGRAVGVVS